ncbi:MAG: hypothetical protein WDM77_17700 [Steroidobacteraceae bacterium]
MKTNQLLHALVLGTVICFGGAALSADDAAHDATHPAGPVDSVGREIPHAPKR